MAFEHNNECIQESNILQTRPIQKSGWVDTVLNGLIFQKCIPDEWPGWKFWKRRRYIVTLMAFFGFFNVYALRANLSIAIVAMTENKTEIIGNQTLYSREFDWDSKMQGYVLSSFFYGYITTQLLGGWLSMRVGGKHLFGFGIAATAFLTLFTPVVAKINVYLLIGLRILEGIFEGVTYPSMHAIWSQWAPPIERSRLATLAFSGAYVGTVVSMPTGGFLAELWGWPSIFYVFGTVGLVWYSIWCFLLAEKPSKDQHISEDELKYITKSLGNIQQKRVKYPWKSILTSLPVWAIISANFSENWGFYTYLTQLPKYMNDILDFDLAKTGLMSALPYLAMAVMLPITGQIADWFLVRKFLTVSQVRKLFNCGGFICQMIFVLCAANTTSPTIALISLILALGLGSFAFAGFCVNYLDIAPQHASVLFGIGNTIGTLPGIVSPIVSGYIVTTPTRAEWQVVFSITAGIYLMGTIIYFFFSTGELQSWADESQNLNKASTNTDGVPNGVENRTFQHDL